MITKDVDGYYASIQYEADEQLEGGTGAVGMDFSIKGFITAPDGIQVEPLNMYRKTEKRLKGELEIVQKDERVRQQKKADSQSAENLSAYQG